MTPFIPWMGGKRRLAKHIIPKFPDHQCYVEPFAGAAALFFMKDPVRSEVLNDVNGDLVTLYRVVQHHLEEFVRQFRWALSSRQIFEWAKLTDPRTLTDIQRAARFYYLQKLSFGAKPTGRTFGTAPSAPPKLNLLRIEEELSQAHLRLARVYIEHLDWRACVAKYDRPYTLFYFDPPYWGTEGYGEEFSLEEYQAIAECAKTMQGKAIISVNDVPEMRAAFTGLPMQSLDISYTVGGGHRGAARKELLIGADK